ncbi:MAG: glycosyltransferase family 4 protein [Acidimicrobiales bacterium]
MHDVPGPMPSGAVAALAEEPRPRRFCFVLPPPERYSPASGGAVATVTRQLSRSLLAAGHPVTVLTPVDGEPWYDDGDVRPLRFGPAAPLPDLAHKAYVVEARLRKWGWPEYGRYRRNVLRTLGSLHPTPDVVVVANDPELAVRLARRRTGGRPILWLHNQLEGREAQHLAHLPPGVELVAVSDAVRSWTADRFGIDPARIAVIHNGVDGDEFHPRDGYTDPRSPLRVVCHGLIDPNKGHDVAAVAVAALRGQGIPVTLTLVGGIQTFGLPAHEVSAYARHLDGVMADADAITTGRISASQVAPVLRGHDVACVLSKSAEPFPLAGLEALASGCAVVTTGAGGLGELMGDAALYVRPDDAAQVAEVLAGLVADPAALAERKRAARRRSEQFTWGAAAAALLSCTSQVNAS